MEIHMAKKNQSKTTNERLKKKTWGYNLSDVKFKMLKNEDSVVLAYT